MPSRPDLLEQLLAQRQQIDRALGEQQRDLTVMFTDIVGSTRYFEEKGDIEGLALIQRHNALLFPIVERHRGRIIKTIGDAIMAAFAEPLDGLRAAIAMQRLLEGDREKSPGDPIHIRIGLHGGKAFAVGNDVFGDTVNTASRVAHEAQGDEIVISAQLGAIAREGGLPVVERGAVALKGKAEPLKLERLLWLEGELAADAGSEAMFTLEVSRGPRGLKVIARDGSAEDETVKRYGERDIAMPQLDVIAAAYSQLGAANAPSYRERLQQVGTELFEKALPAAAKERLVQTGCRFLRLEIDDELTHLPWELLHDGKDFAATRFASGRQIATRSETVTGAGLSQGTRAVVVADPTGDLPAARREGKAIAGLLRDGFGTEVQLLEGPVDRAKLLAALKDCSLLHICGHAVHEADQAGVILADGILSARELAEAFASAPPLLVFANGCFATRVRGVATPARGMFDLASTLLLHGVNHFLGPALEISDDDAQTFALRFYERALGGESLGEATRNARRSVMSSGAPAAFAAYVLYGDPRRALPASAARLKRMPATRSLSNPPAALEPSRRPAMPIIVAATVALLIAAGGFAWLRRTRQVEVTQTPPVAAVMTPREATRPASDRGPSAESNTIPAPALSGPIRICVLPFKNVSGDASLDYLKDAIAESVTTDFGHHPRFRLIENPQLKLDIDYLEQSQSRYVDPATRAQIGKITGAEVIVLGAYQRAGKQVRANARFVNVATGEVLESVREDQPDSKLLELQDRLSDRLRGALDPVAKRLRP